MLLVFFFFNDTATTEIYTLSYTTLFRSPRPDRVPGACAGRWWDRSTAAADRRRRARSEEHTSELQSRLHLVCRLLLEKKKRRRQIRRRPASAGTGRFSERGWGVVRFTEG